MVELHRVRRFLPVGVCAALLLGACSGDDSGGASARASSTAPPSTVDLTPVPTPQLCLDGYFRVAAAIDFDVVAVEDGVDEAEAAQIRAALEAAEAKEIESIRAGGDCERVLSDPKSDLAIENTLRFVDIQHMNRLASIPTLQARPGWSTVITIWARFPLPDQTS